MTLLEIILLGLAIGAVLGGLGGGGAILTVPALVYVIGQSAQDATTSSLVIVGTTSLVGVASYVSSHRVRWKIGIGFGLAGIPAAYAGSYLNHQVNEHYLLIGFSVLMVIAAVAMIGGGQKAAPDNRELAPGAAQHRASTSTSAAASAGGTTTHGGVAVLDSDQSSETTPSRRQPSLVGIVAAGLVVGFLTGFFGVGGGFVIVPALVLVLGLPMQQAVGTSLLIVAANSATSLVARAGVAQFDWSIIVPFTLAAMVATLAGKRVADRLPATKLKIGFAALLVLVAGYTAWHSISQLSSPASAASSTDVSAVSAPVIAPIASVRTQIDRGAQIIDVRSPAEYAAGHLAHATNIDVNGSTFTARINRLDKTGHYVVYCATGRRAAAAIAKMKTAGLTHLTNAGGFEQLRAAGLPSSQQ